MRPLLPMVLLFVTTASQGAEPPRAAPPEEFPQETLDAFAEDAFEERVGERPVAGQGPTPQEPPSVPHAGPAGSLWSDWVDEETLETEIKRQAKRLDEATRSAAHYRSGGYQQAAHALGIIATVMGVIVEHDGVPRWQHEAASLRDLFAEELVGVDRSEASFALVRQRSEALQELIRGGRPEMPSPNSQVDWSELASRASVMHRLEGVESGDLDPWLVDRRALRRHADALRHEAQLVALLAEAMLQPEALDAEDPDYQAFARQLRAGASRLSTAVEQEQLDRAREALGVMQKACADCHADYRG